MDYLHFLLLLCVNNIITLQPSQLFAFQLNCRSSPLVLVYVCSIA